MSARADLSALAIGATPRRRDTGHRKSPGFPKYLPQAACDSTLAHPLPYKRSGTVVTAMKIEIPMLAVLLLAANDLLARAMVQGFEQAVFGVLVERSARWARALQSRLCSLRAN